MMIGWREPPEGAAVVMDQQQSAATINKRFPEASLHSVFGLSSYHTGTANLRGKA